MHVMWTSFRPTLADSDSVTHASTDSTATRRRVRAPAVEYSDWYARRLTIHKWASYFTLPLFVAQYITGERIYKHGQADRTAYKLHPYFAASIGTLFLVNSVTGVWNLTEARHDPEGRVRRTIHGLLMLTADAGFVTTGILARDADTSPQKRDQHRQIALTSMGVALASYLIMLPPFRGSD